MNRLTLALLVLLGGSLWTTAPSFAATTNPPAPARPVVRTNTPASIQRGGTNLPAGLVKTNNGTVGSTSSALSANAAKLWANGLQGMRQWRSSSYFYPSLIGVGLMGLVLYQYLQSRAQKGEAQAFSNLSGKSAKSRKVVINSCNVLQVGNQARQLWKFDSRNNGFVLSREQNLGSGESLPGLVVAKDWRSLWQQKLNIAWLPPEQVFLRVAQFPASDFNETVAMVELQLEKLSPMPVAQIVWSLQTRPHPDGKQQTVILAMVNRNVVEEFLGQLEGQGYLADRLELPVLDQFQATEITEDGAWIYPAAPGRNNSAWVAWWYGGVLQNLDLITLPSSEAASGLKEQLLQMAWAGEMEGWLTKPPQWHLVAEPELSAQWEGPLRSGLEQPIELSEPLRPPQLAALTAKRGAMADGASNLLPAEYATRYKEQFYDRLWMGALMAVGALYLAGVLVYGVAVAFASYRTRSVEGQVAALGNSYTNALQLKARYGILKTRQDLKFAALDCWQAVAELMPESLTLELCTFQQGKTLILNGTAPPDAATQINAFEGELRKYKKDGQFLFDQLKGEHANFRAGPGGNLSWNFRLELLRAEGE